MHNLQYSGLVIKMFCLLLVLTPVFFVEHTESSNDLNVDYILEKMLASETFDKMVDVVARKAAEKINTHLNRKIDRVDNNVQQRKSNNRNDDFQTHIDFAIGNDVISTKIPVKSKLSLKYKLFTKRAVEKSDGEYKNKKSMENISDGEISFIGNLKENNNSTNTREINREGIDYDEIFGKNTKDKDKNIAGNHLALNKERLVFDKIENKDSKYYKGTENNVDINNKVIQKQNHLQKVVTNLEGYKRKDNNMHMKLERSVKPFNLKNITLTPKQIFKEGDRIYALQSSSDYDEFHKELNRTRLVMSSSELSE